MRLPLRLPLRLPMRWTLALPVAGVVLSACTSAPAPAPSVAAQPSGLAPKGPTIAQVPVLRVVDGDTFHALVQGRDTTVRIIGINTPETVKPNSPVECFGPEASDFAHGELDGRTVTLELDPSQDPQDRYGRTLAHAWIEEADGSLRLYELDAVVAGVADERVYGAVPHAWHELLAAAEETARANGTGMWGACS